MGGFLCASDKWVVTFLMAKQRTLHVFNDNGKSISVLLRERDRNVAVFESAEAIPVGVYVECLGPDGDGAGTSGAGNSGRIADDCVATGSVLSCRAVTPQPVTPQLGGPQPGTRPLLEISVEFNGEKSIA